ncbi:peptidoglycan D,D-transpeptidase FtsI family protein [Erythrobacter litoralis]|uniref:Penicillin-binding protein n=1 Tax=Erythrobacter litoralis (strain HTCC2594) TaxID=314225 RepID=Q2NCZ6_ERYLH|nr:penicillin-binding protein 2 [Erythrobacter litoralis]ABC62445.1 penicillin-binding protein [Erythrobacter litoralis HTCC2594]
MSSLAVSTAISSGRVRLVSDRQEALLVARIRVLVVAVGFALLALIALLRIVFLGIGGGTTGPTTLEEALLPPRGEITDRNGIALARNYPARALWFNPDALGEGEESLVKSPDKVVAELLAIFPDLEQDRVRKMLASGTAGYLRRRVLPEEANRVFDIGEVALELPQETDRHYPQGMLGAHVLGYVDSDGGGKVGMEQVLDDRLSNPVLRGEASSLSLDIRVQGALEDELRKGMLSVNAMGAAGIVLDVDTGEILALASLPEFDPNAVKGEDLIVSDAAYKRGEIPRAFNRVTNQVYELGSTFKPLTVAAAIDAGTVRDFGKRYDASGVAIDGFTIRDSHDLGASLNIPQMLIHSSNTVTARVSDELGEAKLRQTFEDLGMHERPYIELPARGHPLWQTSKWGRLKTMNVGFGHGIAVTPLHLASAYAAMVNGGIWRPATLHRIEPGMAPKGRRVFKESTSSRMRQLLRMIALYGTGKNADAAGYRVGGKTGSAEKPGVGGYRRKSLVSTFAAVFPMDNPRFVVIAMLDEPKGTTASSFQRTAAWNAAPIVGKLVPRIGPILGVRPDMTRDVDISDLKRLVPGAAE